MNAATLRTSLLNLLSTDLGKFANNQPSIWVFPPEPPSRSDGIQCLIQRVSDRPTTLLSSGQKLCDRQWTVILTNFNPTKSLDEVITKILSHFVIKKHSYIPATESSFEQARIMIYDPQIIN